MIGGSAFTEVFGAAAPGNADALVSIVRSAINHGFSPILCRPGTKEPLCPLSDRQAAAANREAQAAALAGGMAQVDRVRHPCGLKHVLDDTTKIKAIVDRLVAIHGPALNLAIHLGRSGLIAVDVDTPAEREGFQVAWGTNGPGPVPGITVESPGRFDPATGEWVHWGGGHWFFSLPEGVDGPAAGKVLKGGTGWAAMWGESYVLVPPSVRPEGAYRLVGTTSELPGWLGTAIYSRPVVEKVAWDGAGENGIDAWAVATSWASMLEPTGWSLAGVDGCGCDIWTAPGDHSSPKSATAHEGSCGLGAVRGGGVLHSWTDHPGVAVNAGGNISKLQYVAEKWHAGDVRAAMDSYGMLEKPPAVVEFIPLASAPALGAGFPGNLVSGPVAPVGPVPVVAGRHVAVTPAANIRAAAARWLWEDSGGFSAQWIPLGAITLLAGREGVGKSTILARLIAGVTTGTLPGDLFGQPKCVVLAAGEDAWAQTIVPRLLAAGADLTRVFRVEVTNDGLPGTLELPMDNTVLEQICRHYDVALIALDPLMTIVGGKLDTHKDGDVRKALQPLADLADRVQAAVVGLIHQNKSATGDLLTKMMGSVAFSAVARSVLFAAREPVEETPEGDDTAAVVLQAETFLLGQTKSNLGQKAQVTIQYQIQGVVVGHDDQLGKAITSSRIRDVGAIPKRIEEVVAKPDGRRNKPAPARDAVAEWLVAYLQQQEGPVPAGQIREAADDVGYAWATVKRAAITAEIPRSGSGPSVFWSAPAG